MKSRYLRILLSILLLFQCVISISWTSWDPLNYIKKQKLTSDLNTEIYPGIFLVEESFKDFRSKQPQTEIQRGNVYEIQFEFNYILTYNQD